MRRLLLGSLVAALTLMAGPSDATAIRSIVGIYDTAGALLGFDVNTSIRSPDGSFRTIRLLRSQLPGNVQRANALTQEAWINDWIAQQMIGQTTQCFVHVFNPTLEWNVIVGCGSVPMPPNWWVAD